ncbi:MAG: lipopolysaccharide biosynthesis protein [Crocinitomicaceae bacterium]
MSIDNSLSGSKKLKSNILGSSAFKVISIACSFLLVRACANYMGEEKYGILLTVLSFFVWFSVLEVGISSNFRNRLTKYFSEKDSKNGKTVVSNVYRLLGKTYLVVILLLLIISSAFPFEYIFLPTDYSPHGFGLAFTLSAVFYMLFYIAFALNTILLSTHYAKATYLILALQNTVLLFGIYTFNYLDITPTFLLIFVWFTFVPLFFWVLSNVVIYKTILSDFAPQWNQVYSSNQSFKYNINYGFFIIQLCVLIIFSTDNLIIINKLSGSEVFKYNLAFKYFNILIVVFNVILLPYWSSFAEASHQNNKQWIKTHLKKLILVWFGTFVMGFVLLVSSNYAYHLWIGKTIEISFYLSVFMLISILLTAWNSIFAYYLNSISEVKSQTILSIISAGINIPLSLWLIDIYGAKGVIISTCISLLPLAIVLPIQSFQMIKKMS